MACANCGFVGSDQARFCAECGTALRPGQPVGGSERRICSVLFVDLVDWTRLAEDRDVEEARELLDGYFEIARTIVARYGGTIDKFIGDAVMAVWGAPVAKDDDAERAVRAALELVAAVPTFGETAGAPDLAARGGIVTDEVAVMLGGAEEALIAGDPVNTAARLQSVATPGTVLVNDRTRELTRDAIAYGPPEELHLKGKRTTVRTWPAQRVIAGLRGSERVGGFEAPMVGRDDEFRLLKSLYHDCVERRAAHHVVVVGPPGIGKSRLGWELDKYVDGLSESVWWHRGRCLPYGEGVPFWALTEIVRQRCGIAHDDPPELAEAKLAALLHQTVTDAAERDFVEPLLGALLGLVDSRAEREQLFAAWRLLFERLADTAPVVLMIEDLQYANVGLLDFLDSLLTWSTDHPIFVVSFGRPELLDRRPEWGATGLRRSFIALPALPEATIARLLDGLVDDLTPQLRGDIADRAGGVPLFAVETVRALADRGMVVPAGDGHRLVDRDASAEALGVPASLTALLAARIDALSPPERKLLRAVAVLGAQFPRSAVDAVAETAAQDTDPLLDALIGRDILFVTTDRLSPDQGSYAFTHPMLRQVAYDTLSRRDRAALHQTVAEHLQTQFPDGGEVAEIIATHYSAALAVTTDPDRREALRRNVVVAHTHAAERALTIGAPDVASTSYEAAAAVADDDEVATLIGAAGQAAERAGQAARAVSLLQEATRRHSTAGRDRDAARLRYSLARALAISGRMDAAIDQLSNALDAVDNGEPDADAATIAQRLGDYLNLAGRNDEAIPHVERALADAQALDLPEVITAALSSRAWLLIAQERHGEAVISSEASVVLAETYHLSHRLVLARNNAAMIRRLGDMPGVVEHLAAALDAAHRYGDRNGELLAITNINMERLDAGDWDEIPAPDADRFHGVAQWELLHVAPAYVCLFRGEDPTEHLRPLREYLAGDAIDVSFVRSVFTRAHLEHGELEAALAAATEPLAADIAAGGLRSTVRDLKVALEASVQLGRLDETDRLITLLAERPIGHLPPSLRAELHHYRARLSAARGRHDDCEPDFTAAAAIFERLGRPFQLAEIRLSYAAWLAERGRTADARDQALAAEERFVALRAKPAGDRARALLSQLREPAAT
ncbi:MAG TPA: adenylate/guanylate cyclase domain-containing protein [Mycobacteriales bacterium]|nr:adenylate/guanylate cyclase domain-containing protein [Mycobacteriales bacterium]